VLTSILFPNQHNRMAQIVPIRLLVLFCVLISSALFEKMEAAPPNGVIISFQPKKTMFTLHEPIIIFVEIRNNLVEPINVDLGRDRKQNFLFFVTTPNGDRVQLPEIRKSGFSRSGVVNLNAAESYRQPLLLNEWREFDKTGRYQIEVSMTGSIRVEKSEQPEGRLASRFSIEILPLNQPELKNVCADLEGVIESSQSYEEAAQAASALSYVEDEIAIPYLRRALLATKLVEPFAVQGLERIGTFEAVRALASGFQVKYNNTPALTASALMRIEDKTADPQIKGLIESTMREQRRQD